MLDRLITFIFLWNNFFLRNKNDWEIFSKRYFLSFFVGWLWILWDSFGDHLTRPEIPQISLWIPARSSEGATLAHHQHSAGMFSETLDEFCGMQRHLLSGIPWKRLENRLGHLMKLGPSLPTGRYRTPDTMSHGTSQAIPKESSRISENLWESLRRENTRPTALILPAGCQSSGKRRNELSKLKRRRRRRRNQFQKEILPDVFHVDARRTEDSFLQV